MKSTYILIYLCSTFLFGQKKCGYVNGLQEGNCLTYYDDGKLKWDTNYKKGKLDGKYVAFHENGKVKASGVYKKDMKVGEWKYYDISGSLVGIEKHSNWKGDVFIDQLEIIYYQNGKVSEMSKGTYINDLEEGIIKTFDSSGKLIRESNFVNGKREGEQRYYDTNGKIIKTEIYKNNELVSSN